MFIFYFFIFIYVYGLAQASCLMLFIHSLEKDKLVELFYFILIHSGFVSLSSHCLIHLISLFLFFPPLFYGSRFHILSLTCGVPC